MNYGFRKNIRVFWNMEFGTSHTDEQVSSNKEGLISLKNRVDIAVKNAEKSNLAAVRDTLAILKATDVYTTDWWQLAKAFGGGRTESGALSIIGALEAAKKSGLSQIVLFSTGSQYRTMSMKDYENEVSNNPENINQSVTKGLIDLYRQGGGFKKETWENISIYCEKRNWNSKIMTNWTDEDKKYLREIYNGKIKQEETIYQGILKEFIGKIDDTNLRNLLTQNNLEKTPDGKIDIRKLIMRLNIKNPKEVPGLLEAESEKLKKAGIELLNRAREDQKTLTDLKDLKSLNIPNIPSSIERKAFASFTRDECIKYIPIIDELLKKEQNPIKKRELEKIKGILIKAKKGYENIKDSGSVHAHAKITNQNIKANPNASLESVIENSESEESRRKESLSGETTVTRATIEQGNNILKDMGVKFSSFEEIQEQYNSLLEKERKTGLTIDEERIKTQLYAQIQSNIRAAQVIRNYEGLLSKKDIQEVFTDANKFISQNPTENYNFQALEKIATLTDPESSPGQKSLAKLESGQSLTMSKALQGEMTTPITNAPELNQVNISKNQDGTYNIPLFDAKGISKEQVEEYKESTKLYAELGLSQFIPHIPLINSELRKKGIDATIDGQVSTSEQQHILKVLYSKLFGKEIISSNLTEVERAFSSALSNPTNMKNAMQNVLIKHKLISGSNQPIRADNLKNFISNQEKSPDPTTDFHFI